MSSEELAKISTSIKDVEPGIAQAIDSAGNFSECRNIAMQLLRIGRGKYSFSFSIYPYPNAQVRVIMGNVHSLFCFPLLKMLFSIKSGDRIVSGLIDSVAHLVWLNCICIDSNLIFIVCLVCCLIVLC